MTQSDLTLAIQSFDSIKRPDAALALYERVTHSHPSLLGKIPLIALLKSLKSSPALASEGMKIYKSACADTSHFPGLKSDSNTALSLLSSLMASDIFTKQDLSDALMVKDNISQSGVQPTSVIYGFLINLAGRAMNYPVALEVYNDMLSSSVPTTAHVESCLLEIARKTKNYPDCWVIYNRIVENKDTVQQLQLNYYIVNVMLDVCMSTGETRRGLEIALNWYTSRGMLTWPIIGNIVALCMKSVEEVNDKYDYDLFVQSMTVLHRKNNRASIDRVKSTSSASASASGSATGSPSSVLFSQEELPLYMLSIAVDHVVQYLEQQQRRNNSTRGSSSRSDVPNRQVTNRQVTSESERSVPSVKHKMEDRVPVYILTTTAPLLLAMGKMDLLFDYIDNQRQRMMIQSSVSVSSEVEEDDDSSNDTFQSESMMTAVVEDDVVRIVRSLWRMNNWRYLWSLKHRLDHYRPIYNNINNNNSIINNNDPYVKARIRVITYCLLSMSNSPSCCRPPTTVHTSADLSVLDGSRVEHCMKQLVEELVLYKTRPVDLQSLMSTIINSFIRKSSRVEESTRVSNQRIFVAFISLLMKEQKDLLIAHYSIALTEQQYRFVQDSVSSSLHAHNGSAAAAADDDDALIQFINSTFMKPHITPATNISR